MLICHRTNFIQKTTFIFKWQGKFYMRFMPWEWIFSVGPPTDILYIILFCSMRLFFIVYLAPNLNIYISNKNVRAENLCTKWKFTALSFQAAAKSLLHCCKEPVTALSELGNGQYCLRSVTEGQPKNNNNKNQNHKKAEATQTEKEALWV